MKILRLFHFVKLAKFSQICENIYTWKLVRLRCIISVLNIMLLQREFCFKENASFRTVSNLFLFLSSSLRQTLDKTCGNTCFHWPVFSRVKTESYILYIYERVRISENPYSPIFYAVRSTDVLRLLMFIPKFGIQLFITMTLLLFQSFESLLFRLQFNVFQFLFVFFELNNWSAVSLDGYCNILHIAITCLNIIFVRKL